MKIKDIYRMVVEVGIQRDPRGKKEVEKILKKTAEDFKELKEDQKKEYDRDRLTNPYADTRILCGNPDKEVRRLILGIDMEIGEVLLADRLTEKGRTIDLVVAHHPEGRALANFYEVMGMQADILGKLGVNITLAEGKLAGRMKDVERSVMPINHTRAVDAAKLLGIPMMCTHTVADNCVATFLQDLMDRKKPETVKDAVKLLKEIPEYRHGMENNAGPKVVAGSDHNKTGRIFVDMTGGTEGPKDIFERISLTGVGTIVAMHFSADHIKEIEKQHINAIVAGHMASDNLGLNLLYDEVQKKDRKLEIVACSGFFRHSRKK